jgi:integrase/recombinase XerD
MKNALQKPTIKLLLDKRRVKDNNSYPLKFYIICNRKGHWYSTGISMTEKELEKINSGKYLSSSEKDLAQQIASLSNHYHSTAENTFPFDFESFERKLNSKYYGISENVFQMFNIIIDSLTEEERLKTASSYRTTMNVLKAFTGTETLSYLKINVEFLKSFERYVVKPNPDKENKANSIATAGIYLRNIRAVYNRGISEKLISNEFYPFGRRKYEIRSKVRTKKAISLESLKTLLAFVPEQGSIDERELDFWKFSFWCHGMNPKDIAKLKWKDIDQNGFSFYRTKSERTSKMQVPIQVTMSDELRIILKRLGMGLKSPTDYIFPVYSDGMSAGNKNNKIQTYNKNVNKRVNEIGERLGITESLNMYAARHTFVNLLVYSNVPVSAIKDMVGHTNSQTTESYINSIEVSYQKGVMQKLGDLVK